jgi:2-polyprenyl-3-methyl-5-hydroxy-6-metoxy-1,4-benzoquinol methylase
MTPTAEPGPRCPLCTAEETVPRFEHGAYTIFACRSCRGGFAWPRLRPGELDAVYDEEYAGEYESSPLHDVGAARLRFRDLEASLRRYAPRRFEGAGRRLLDVGCASGRLARAFLERGWHADGVEILPRFAEEARSAGVVVHQGDFLRLDLAEGSYDLLTMFHVIEHLGSPFDAAVKCLSLLRPGGLLVLETPNWRGVGALLRGSKWPRITPPEHLNYFGPHSLTRLVLRAGFSEARATTVTPQIIASAARAPRPAQLVVRGGYRLASILGIGTNLQVFASKGRTPGDGAWEGGS